MTVTSQALQGMYELFNSEDPGEIVDLFAPDAFYHQLNSDMKAVGRGQIADVMAVWRTSFEGARIEGVRVSSTVDRVAEVDGAVQCFLVEFVGRGRYVNSLPGLEAMAPATGREVALPITEAVWLNDAGQFLRVDNTIQVTALK